MKVTHSTFIDITVPIQSGMITWPGDPAVSVIRTMDVTCGDHATVSRLDLGSHTGTHVDAFNHFKPGGETVDTMDLSIYVGPAVVVPIQHPAEITVEELRQLEADGSVDWSQTQRVLFQTPNSHVSPSSLPWYAQPFNPDFVHLTEDAAKFLVERGLQLVGVDALSVDGFHHSDGVPVHHVLMDAGVYILEGLNLCEVSPGPYELICLPMKLANGDGAPARVVLRDLSPLPSCGGMPHVD